MTTIQVRIDDQDKKAVEKILKMIGIDLPTAIRAFLKRVNQVKGIPFPLIAKPMLDENGLTEEEVDSILKAEKEAEAGINVSGPFSSMDEMIAHLNKPE